MENLPYTGKYPFFVRLNAKRFNRILVGRRLLKIAKNTKYCARIDFGRSKHYTIITTITKNGEEITFRR